VLRELGAEVVVYGHQPDGMNINCDCGSMHPEAMCRKTIEHKADLGIAPRWRRRPRAAVR